MWKRYLALGAAVCMLAGVSTVSRAAETVSSGEPEQMDTEVQGQETELSETPVMEQAEVSAQSASGTYAASGTYYTEGTYVPYEGAKYALRYGTKLTGGGLKGVIIGITNYESKDDLGELVIPERIGGAPLTEIGNNAFSGCFGLTGELVIPDSVTTIGYGAFNYCFGLTGDLVIPDSVTEIGSYAFYCCNGLTGELVIPNSVTEIGSYAFSGCSGLTGELVIPDSVTTISPYTFSSCRGLTGDLTIPDSVTEIGNNAFSGCSGLTGELVIPDSVTAIRYGAFSGCNGLTGDIETLKNAPSIWEGAFAGWSGLTGELIIPDSVKTIGEGVFNNCSGISGINIANSVTEIGSYAFYCCNGLTGELIIPNSVTEIGNGAFQGCSAISSVEIAYSVRKIGNDAFSGCSGLTGSLTIPRVTTIGERAFEDCSGLTGELVIPDSVTWIGRCAFSGCSGLTGGLVIPNSVKEIEPYAFSGCSGLTGDLVISDNSETWIWYRAFEGCNGLTGDAETLVEKLKNVRPPWGGSAQGGPIWEGAFAGWSGLTGELVIPDSVTTIADKALEGCSGLTGELIIPHNVKRIGDSAFEGCSGLTSLVFNGGQADVITGEGRKIGNRAFYGCSGLTGDLIIAYGSSIGAEAFKGCSGLTGSLAVYVRTVGSEAFKDCSGLTGSLDINVETIGDGAFFGCSGLTIKKEERFILDGVRTIGAYAFSGCSSLRGNLSLGRDVTWIGRYAFEGCSGLAGGLYIPDSVTEIGRGAFEGSSISSINIPSSVTQLYPIFGDYTNGIQSIEVYGKETEVPEGLGDAFVYTYSNEYYKSPIARDASKWNYTVISMSGQKVAERKVSTAEELIEAIGAAGEGSYQRIVLADGVYNITDTIALDRVVFVTLEAKNPGKAEIVAQDPSKPVISVNQCADVNITGCVLGYVQAGGSIPDVRERVNVRKSYNVRFQPYGQPVTANTSGIDMNISVDMMAEAQKKFAAGLAAQEGVAAEGDEVSVEITVSDARNSLSRENMIAVNQAAKRREYQIGVYLDITMSIQVDGSSKKVSRTDTPLRLVIEIPLAWRRPGRIFSVIRLHEGEIVLLRDLDSNPDTITIETDRFSSYTMVYKDTAGKSGSISGSIKSFGESSQGALVQLLDSAGNVIAQTTAAAGSSGAYELEVVEQGNYTLTVSKAGHVTRSYAVTLDGESLELNAEIRLKGDVNGDGKADSLDKRTIYGHIAGSNTLNGYEFQVGDVDGSGRIDALDKRMIYGHIAGTSPLW